MANTEEKKITDLLTENVLNTRFEDIDRATIDNTRRRVLDMIGNIIGGAMCPGDPELAELVKDWGGKKESTILGFGTRVPAHEAALVNCIFGRAFDRGPLTIVIEGNWGPYTIMVNGKPINRFASHISETTIPTALALAESRGVSGKEFITALVVGDDLSVRLHIASDRTPPGQAANPDIPQAPMTRGSTDTFGAAAITGRLLGLNRNQMKHAFALCLTFMGGGMTMPRAPAKKPGSPASAGATQIKQGANPGWLGIDDPFFKAAMAQGGYEETTSTKLMQGIIARRGINAAQLARAGWTGLKDAFFNERGGYYPGTNSVSHPERVIADLGKKYYVEQVFKPWPGGRPTNGPTEAALAIVSKNDINTDDIEEVILHLSRPAAAVHYSKPYIIGEYPTMNALWSFYFAVGSTLYRKSSKNENFTEEKIRDPKLQALIKKVKLADLDKPEGIELEVKMKDGRTFSEYASQVLGEPYRPLSRDGLIAKFMEQVEFSQLISKSNAEKIIELVEKLEEVENIQEIIKTAVKRK